MYQLMADAEPKNRRGRPRTDPGIVRRIVELRAAGHNFRAIQHVLEVEGTPVAYNTVRAVVGRVLPPDPASGWCLVAGDGLANSRPDLVLSVIGELIARSAGTIHGVTGRTADWLVAIRLAAPDIPLWGAWDLAMRYRRCELREASTERLDFVLAVAPWRMGGDELAALKSPLLGTVLDLADPADRELWLSVSSWPPNEAVR